VLQVFLQVFPKVDVRNDSAVADGERESGIDSSAFKALALDLGWPSIRTEWSQKGRKTMQYAAAQTQCRKPRSERAKQRDELITVHLDMALKMARKMARRLPSAVSRDDVESAALLGLTEAASRYDTSRQEPFMAFAAKRVRGAILDHLRKNDILSRRARQGARKVLEVACELEASLGRAPTDAEIASSMGMTELAFNRAYSCIRAATVIHLDDLRGELCQDGRDGILVGETQRRKSALMRALEILDDREQMVLSCYYREGLTLKEIGALLGVTESRVCQIHTHALASLRIRLS